MTSSADTRSRLPERRTLPSSTARTCSFAPMLRTSSRLPLKTNTEVRDATRSPPMCDRELMISSVIPSLSTSSSGRPLELVNGRTATERASAAASGSAAAERSASANPCRVWNRSAGALASARMTARTTLTGASGRTVPSGGTESARWRAITACGVAAVNGGRPASISYSTHPSEYSSLRPSTSPPPAHASGLMYSGVPITKPASVRRCRVVEVTPRATPKSAMAAWLSSNRMFSGFTSRWTTPWRCA